MSRILVFASLGFVGGILASLVFTIGLWFPLFLTVVYLALYYVKKKGSYLLAAVFMVGVLVGVGRTSLAPQELPIAFVPLLNTEVSLTGVIVSDPDTRETSNRITVRIEHEGVQTKVLAVTPLYPDVSLGQRVEVRGTFALPEPFDTSEGRVFRYDQFLAKDGVFAIMPRASITVLEERSGVWNHIRGTLSDIKFIALDALGTALSEPQASLASGLLLGGKQGLGADLLNDFIRTGLVHIVVLSGYNVMIVAEMVLRMFGFLSRRSAAVAALITIALFVLAAGAGAASIRAGLMAGIALYGRATGRTYDALRALMVAGLAMLLMNPLLLLYDPGFQLSFIATLGLILGTPLLEKRLAFIQYAPLREIVSATLAAQTAVLPLLLYQNGLFSVVALPANILVLPMIPVAMLCAVVAGLAGFLLPFAAPFIALPAYVLLSFVILIAEGGAALPLAAFSVPAFPFIGVVVAYGALAFLVYRFTPLLQGSDARQHPNSPL